jgi:hypothetical protein
MPKIGAASPSFCAGAGAMEATAPASAATATSTNMICLMERLLRISLIERTRDPAFVRSNLRL